MMNAPAAEIVLAWADVRPSEPVVHLWLVANVGWTVLIDRTPWLCWPKDAACIGSHLCWGEAFTRGLATCRTEGARLFIHEGVAL